MNRLISIVVPIYNMEQYMHRCIKSLLDQTISNYEILLIDDGSTDGSGNICDQYTENYPELVRVIHKANRGLSSARNVGIDNAVGDYIIFPDPDDWVEPNYLETLFIQAEQNLHYLSCTGYRIEYDDMSDSPNSDSEIFIWNKSDSYMHLLIKPSVNGFAWNKLYRTDVIKNNNLRFLDDVGTKEDLDFAFRYLSQTDCEGIKYNPSADTYHYYQRSGAATRSGFSYNKYLGIRVYEKMMTADNMESRFISEAKASICSSALNLTIDYLLKKVDDKEIWLSLRKYIRNNWIYCIFSRYTSLGRKYKALVAVLCPKLLLKI